MEEGFNGREKNRYDTIEDFDDDSIVASYVLALIGERAVYGDGLDDTSSEGSSSDVALDQQPKGLLQEQSGNDMPKEEDDGRAGEAVEGRVPNLAHAPRPGHTRHINYRYTLPDNESAHAFTARVGSTSASTYRYGSEFDLDIADSWSVVTSASRVSMQEPVYSMERSRPSLGLLADLIRSSSHTAKEQFYKMESTWRSIVASKGSGIHRLATCNASRG